MPTYDYECQSCGHVFEYFQSMSDDPLSECPKCGKQVKRLIGGGLGIIFKGSGFYVTDNRSGSKKGSSEGKSTGGSDASKPGESKAGDSKPSDSKPAEKSGKKESA